MANASPKLFALTDEKRFGDDNKCASLSCKDRIIEVTFAARAQGIEPKSEIAGRLLCVFIRRFGERWSCRVG